MSVPLELSLSFAGVATGVFLAERLGYHPKWCTGIVTRQVLGLTAFCLGVILPVTLLGVYTASGWTVLLVLPFSLLLRITFLWRENEFKRFVSDQKFVYNLRENEDKKTFNFRYYR